MRDSAQIVDTLVGELGGERGEALLRVYRRNEEEQLDQLEEVVGGDD